MTNIIKPDRLRELLKHEESDGKLFYRERLPKDFRGDVHSPEHSARKWNSRHAGKEAFVTKSNGYLMGTIDYQRLYAHRVIWAMVHDEWPEQIDHINGIRSDNRLCNLRLSTQMENMKSVARRRNNTTGHAGVVAHQGGYRARICSNYRYFDLGVYDSVEEASKAYEAAKIRLGFAERHGLPISEVPHE